MPPIEHPIKSTQHAPNKQTNKQTNESNKPATQRILAKSEVEAVDDADEHEFIASLQVCV